MSVNAGSAIAYLDLDSSKFVSGMQRAAQQMKEFSREGSTTNDKMTALGNISKSVGSAMTQYLTLPLVGVGAASVKVATDFESGMSKVSALSGATGSDLKMLEDKAREMGSTTKYSSTEASEALQYMALAGFDANEMASALEPTLKLAGASGMELATASDIVTDTLSMFGMEATETARMTDVLAYAQANSNTNVEQLGEALKYCGASANAMGYDIEDTTSILGIFADQGLKGSSAGTTLNSMFRDMKNKAKDGAIAIGDSNIAITDANGNYRDMTDILADVEVATKDMTSAERDMALSSIWGTEALKGVNMAFEAGSDEIKSFEGELRNSKGTAEEMYAVMQDNLKGSIDNFKSALEGAGITIGNILLPSIRDMVDKFTEALTWFNNLDEGTQRLIVGVGGTVAAIGPLLLVFGSVLTMIPNMVAGWGILSGAMAGFTFGIPLLIAALGGIVLSVGSSTDALQFLKDKFGIVGTAIGVVCEHIYGVAQLTFGNIGILIQTAGEMAVALFSGQFWKLDDIAREGWAKVENNTAKALSNMSAETSMALSLISSSSEAELSKVEGVFDKSLSVLPNLTKHNIDSATKQFTTSLQGMNDDGLTILRGTSDTMAIVLEGISADMIGTKDGSDKMKANLESLAVAGGVSAKDLEKEVGGALKTIGDNMVTEGDKLKQNATDVFNSFKTISTSSVADMSSNVVANIQSMGEGTVSQLSSMGGTWSSILKGVKDDGSMSTAQMKEAIIQNLSNMGITGEELVNKLRTESSKHMNSMEKEADKSTKGMSSKVDSNTKNMEKKATKNAENTKKNVSKTTKDMAKDVDTNSKKAGKSMDTETKKGGDAVSKNMNKASKEAQKEASNISKNVDKEMKNSTKSLKQESTNMYNGVKTSFSKMSQISKQETTNMYKGVKTSFKAMESSAKTSASSMYSGVKASFNKMADSAIADWNKIKKALKSPITGTVKIKVQGVEKAINQINSLKNQAKKSSMVPNYSDSIDSYGLARYTEGDLQRSLYSMIPSVTSYNSNDVNVKINSNEEASIKYIKKLTNSIESLIDKIEDNDTEQDVSITIDGREVFKAISPYMGRSTRGI
ncbi:MAG: phage tail tape measure protein [Peptostreptococcaceae bacterium]|uniref:phage tail tape measure protein n=1 Tax=Clostridium sp. TaxID=1506 RepID=UPI0030560194